MSAATFLHTGMRPPAPESRRQELDDLIAALDKDDFNKSLFAQFNALHPKLGDTLKEVEDFKRSGKIPPAHVLAEWREMGEQVSAKGHENLGQALTNATEICGHLQAIQNDGDVVGATMGLLGSLQNGFSKSRNGGFIGGIYQQLNDLSKQISTVYFHLSHQIEAANQRNIREHQTTRYNLAVMAQGIQGYLETLQRSSSEQGACMVHYMQNLGGRLDNVSQHTNYMLDELAMDPFQQALFSIDSQYAQDKPQPERVTAQLEVVERWLNQPPIKQKLNGTFFAQQPKEEQLAFLRSVKPDSPQFVGFMAQLLKQEGVEDIPNVPLMGAILSGYEKAQLKLIEAHHDRDSQALVLKEIEKRLATMIGVVQKLKGRETFNDIVEKQHQALLDAQKAARSAVNRAHEAVTKPLDGHVFRILHQEFIHSIEQTFDQSFGPMTRFREHSGSPPYMCNALDWGNHGPGLITPLQQAKDLQKGHCLANAPVALNSVDLFDDLEHSVSSLQPSFHCAILRSPNDVYLRPVSLPLNKLANPSHSLQYALFLERVGRGRLVAEATLEGMVRHCVEDGSNAVVFSLRQCDLRAPLSVKINLFYTHQNQKILVQETQLSLEHQGIGAESIFHDPMFGIYCSNWNNQYLEFPGGSNPASALVGWNGDALGLIISARWLSPQNHAKSTVVPHNESLLQQMAQKAQEDLQQQINDHMTLQPTAAKALLDQAKADYEHARLMLCSYAEWMGMEVPKYPVASSKVQGKFLEPLPAAPVFREPPKTAVETDIESLQHTIPQVRVNLAKRRSQQVEVVDEQKELDEMGRLKARVEAQDQRIQDLMAIVLMQQKMIVQMQQKDED